MSEKKTVLKFRQEKDEDGEVLMARALYVEDVPEDEEDTDQPPTDGMQYLRRVIKERRRIPDTVTAEIDPEKLKAAARGVNAGKIVGLGRNMAPVPELCCPSLRWQNQQVADFSDVRLKLVKHLTLLRSTGELAKVPELPGKDNEMLWCIFSFGSKMWQEVTAARDAESDRESVVSEPASGQGDDQMADQDEEEEEAQAEACSEEQQHTNQMLETIMNECSEGTPPTVSILVSLPIHVLEQVLQYQVSWLKLVGWRPGFGAWLYALLARIEKPLNPDLGSVLRDLALFCSHQRHQLAAAAAATSGKQEQHKEDEDIAAFNLLICLVAKYFDQSDLADTEP